jgi:hypothetical protein
MVVLRPLALHCQWRRSVVENETAYAAEGVHRKARGAAMRLRQTTPPEQLFASAVLPKTQRRTMMLTGLIM